MAKAIRTFDVEEGYIAGGRYQITIKFADRVVGTFNGGTRQLARKSLRAAGYQLVARVEGRNIVCQEE